MLQVEHVKYGTIRKEGAMGRSVVMMVGDQLQLGISKGYIIYAGMPTEKTYSLVQKKWGFPYQGFAWNLFFPKERDKITIEGTDILLENVTADEIRLRIE
jgi:hypothetical protein